MRNLIMSDVYKMSKILGKMHLKLDTKGKGQEEVGAEMAVKFAENLHMAEAEVNDFLGSLIGITGDDFGKLGFMEAAKYIDEFKNLDGVADFLKLAGRLTKQK